MEKRDYERRDLIASLMKIEHGKYAEYIDMGLKATRREPDLFSHFITWNGEKGKVRDTKVAYPVIALRALSKGDRKLQENAIANLLKLHPRDLLKAYDFSKSLSAQGMRTTGGSRELLMEGIRGYLQVRQLKPKWWDKAVLSDRDSMKRLYRISHIKPTRRAQEILFEGTYPADSIFTKVVRLGQLPPTEAAAIILTNDIPFQVIVGAMNNIKHPDVILALLNGATGNQVVNNSKMFERLGVNNDPVLKAAYSAAIARAKDDKRLNVLKAGEAAEKMLGGVRGSSMRDELINLQNQATKKLGSIEGNWLILTDCSGSMGFSIEVGKRIASLVTERVSGKVWLVFFNTAPMPFEVTGKTFFQINQMTSGIRAGGGTSIGCGLDYIMSRKEQVDGIVIISDGGDNTSPYFKDVYPTYCNRSGSEPTVYWIEVRGDDDRRWFNTNLIPGMERFDLTQHLVDYNSLPNIVQLLRANKYSLLDEILETPLLTMEGVLNV